MIPPPTTLSFQLPTLGFTKCIDYPHLPGHVYYEGYFHALHGEDGGDRHIASMNPRTGCNMQKPAAPRELRAFIEGMRRANTPRLVKALSDVAKAEPGNRLVVKVMRLIEEGRVFADLAVQIHAGQAVERADIGWHTDGPNSILHAALSIAGARALHSRRHADADPSTMEGEFVEPMSPGDVYVSSPAAFAHGVSYGQAYRWSKRTIAVQARFLFDGATEAYGFVEPDEMGDWAGLMRALSSSLAGSPLELPDMSTVLGVMAELERKEGAAIQPPPVTTHAGSTPAAALRKKPAVVTSSS